MTKNEKGFTLIEVLIALSLIALLSTIAVFTPNDLYNDMLLTSTALKVKSALYLSQRLSLNESREYCVEIIGSNYRVREYVTGGKIILVENINTNISISKESDSRIFYTRDGTTKYGKFVFVNNKGKKINIDTLLGTGKVRISDIY